MRRKSESGNATLNDRSDRMKLWNARSRYGRAVFRNVAHCASSS